MTVLYFLLCILQPICLPIPEVATVLWGTMTIGPAKSFFFGVSGALIGIAAMYWISHKFGAFLMKKFHCEHKIKRFQDYIKKYQVYIIGILFVVPILPDEIICIGSSVVGIRFSLFMSIAFLAKVVSVGMIAYSETFGQVVGLGSIEIIGIELAVLFVVAELYRRKEKADLEFTPENISRG